LGIAQGSLAQKETKGGSDLKKKKKKSTLKNNALIYSRRQGERSHAIEEEKALSQKEKRPSKMQKRSAPEGRNILI